MPAQMRGTSDLATPDSAPSAATKRLKCPTRGRATLAALMASGAARLGASASMGFGAPTPRRREPTRPCNRLNGFRTVCDPRWTRDVPTPWFSSLRPSCGSRRHLKSSRLDEALPKRLKFLHGAR